MIKSNLFLKRVRILQSLGDSKLVGKIGLIVGYSEIEHTFIVYFHRYMKGERFCTGFPYELGLTPKAFPNKARFLGLGRKNFEVLTEG